MQEQMTNRQTHNADNTKFRTIARPFFSSTSTIP
jgi:hypothetical protein